MFVSLFSLWPPCSLRFFSAAPHLPVLLKYNEVILKQLRDNAGLGVREGPGGEAGVGGPKRVAPL